MVPVDEWRSRLHIVEEVRVIANLFELHQNIEQLYFILGLSLTIYNVDVTAQNTLVELLLHLAHSNVKVDLFFRLQRALNVRFKTPQHKRS